MKMEFLAESIGLLGIEEQSQPPQQQEEEEQQKQSNVPPASSTSESYYGLSFPTNFSSFAGIASSSFDEQEAKGPNNNERQESDSTVEISNVLGDSVGNKKLIATELIADANSLLEEEDDEIVELETSNISLLSSLTPSSPLTIDASASSNYLSMSMNLFQQSSTSIDIRNIGSGERRSSGLDPTVDELDIAFQTGLNNSENDVAEDAVEDSASQHHPQHHHLAQYKHVDNILTKHVTQRIDARTNFNCFTGEIDAITGHIINGTMIYHKTGTVYEGPFITKYIEPQCRRRSNEGIIQSEQKEETEGDDIICDTIAWRHGTNATCHWTNGHSFKGSFEFDYPKSGTYSCKPPLTSTNLSEAQHIGEWSYAGPLLTVVVNEEESNNEGGLTISSPPASGNSDVSINNLRIGVSNPLPGSVVFHGKGRLERSNGLVYQGEFENGLAGGVGKETSSTGVYSGEFYNGLRHGVGTLMEEYYIEECPECGDDSNTTTEENDDETESLSSGERKNSSQFDVDTGPDAAAGGSAADSLSSLPTAHNSSRAIASDINDNTNDHATSAPSHNDAKQCKSCKGKLTRTKKQRYSSGVWIAGHIEVEDSRGTVDQGKNQFIEEAAATTSTGTTWDLLDEKWLGV